LGTTAAPYRALLPVSKLTAFSPALTRSAPIFILGLVNAAFNCSHYFFLSLPLIPYPYGVEVFIFLYIYTQSVGLVGRVISSSQGLYINTGQHTHDHGLRASEDSSCLRPRGHRDRPVHMVSG
jgi:hypothetical protein